MTNKKFLFIGMAVLLSASLFFLGCGGDDEPEPGNGSGDETANWYDGLGTGLEEAADGTVTLAETTTLLSAAVTVPAGKTLVVDTGKTLAIGTGGSLAGEPASGSTAAAAFVVKAGGTVTGGANFYKAETALASVVAGVYAWDAAAGGGSTAGWKQTAEDLSAGYSLRETNAGTDATESGVSIASVLKNTATGVVTITLDGKFEPEYLYYGDGKLATPAKAGTEWDVGGWTDGTRDIFMPPAGKYGAVNIRGFFPAEQSNVAIQFKPYPGIVFYTGHTAFVSSTVLTGPASADPGNFVSATESETQRWRLYPSIVQNDTFGVLLYSEAATKTVTLDIDADYVSADSKTDLLNVVIDYSGVDFTAVVTETDVTANYTLKVSDAENAADDEASGLTLVSAKRNNATNAVTIKLGGTFNAAYLYTVNNEHTGTPGGSWVGGPWANSGSQAAAGKYGAVFIEGFSPGNTAMTNVGVQTKPYPALGYYKGGGTFPENPFTGPTIEAGNMYLAPSGDNHQKWKLFTTQLRVNEIFGVLLYDGAAAKTVTIDFDQYDGATDAATKTGDILTVTIDYTDVVWSGS
jgi:hypothetical protein